MYTYREYILYIRMLRYTFYMPFGPHYDFCTLLFQSTYQVKCSSSIWPALRFLQFVTSFAYAATKHMYNIHISPPMTDPKVNPHPFRSSGKYSHDQSYNWLWSEIFPTENLLRGIFSVFFPKKGRILEAGSEAEIGGKYSQSLFTANII